MNLLSQSFAFSLGLAMLKISIVLSVFGLGLRTDCTDATSFFRRPADLARGFLSMNVVMPACALALAMIFNFDPGVKIAFVALSVSPVPARLPRKVLKGEQEEYTFGLLVVMALLAIVVVPLVMDLLERISGTPLLMPAHSVAPLVLDTILVPLLAGIILRDLAPWLAEQSAGPIAAWASFLMVLGVLPVLFVSSQTIFFMLGNGTLLAFIAFAFFGVISGYALGGRYARRRIVLALATTFRHPGIAVAIAGLSSSHQGQALPAIALYMIVSEIVSAVIFARGRQLRASSDESEGRLAA